MDSSDAGNLVGYKRPPKHSRFKKGSSGNPNGRPRGARNVRTEFLEEMNEKVPVTLAGKSQELSKQRIAIKGLVAHAMKGDIRASLKVIELALKLCPEEEPDEDLPISANDREILAAFLKRNGAVE